MKTTLKKALLFMLAASLMMQVFMFNTASAYTYNYILGTLEVSDVSATSISVYASFPVSGAWANNLALQDTTTGVWKDFNNKPSTQQPYRTTGIYTETGLKPNTRYALYMSWYNANTSSYENLPIQYVTTGPSLQIIGASQTSISVNATFYQSAVSGNTLIITDTTTGIRKNFNNQSSVTQPYRKSGVYTETGLNPNTKYQIYMICYNSATGENQDFTQYVTTGTLPRVLVLVNSQLYSQLQNSLETYKMDLLKEGYDAVIEPITDNGDVNVLKNKVKEKYTAWQNSIGKLKGVFLVGNLAYAKIKATDEFSSYEFNQYHMSDWYITDMDGVWNDTNGNGILDTLYSNKYPELWVGRLYFGQTLDTDTNYISYFKRNHMYRTVGLGETGKAAYLSFAKADNSNYNTDGSAQQAASQYNALSSIYPNITITIPDSYTDACATAINEFAKDYEFIDYTSHGAPYLFDLRSDGDVTTSQIKNISPSALFMNTHSCSTARYNWSADFLGGVFLTSNTLEYIGATCDSRYYPEQDVAMKNALNNGKTFGEAVNEIYNQGITLFGNQGNDIGRWGMENVLLGDPTLKLSR